MGMKEEVPAAIREQCGQNGISVDYCRERFALDKGLSRRCEESLRNVIRKRLNLPW